MSEARPVVTLARALCDEYHAIHGEDVPTTTDHSPEAVEQAYRAAATAKKQAALCLSGGGIRSAAFSLGVLQALARKGLLSRFHYLSTVSGGGYAGAWLSAMLIDASGSMSGLSCTRAGICTSSAATEGSLSRNAKSPRPATAPNLTAPARKSRRLSEESIVHPFRGRRGDAGRYELRVAEMCVYSTDVQEPSFFKRR